MGFAQFVESVISRLRKAGKSKNEITEILETAAEKSTVNGMVSQGREPETAFEPHHKTERERSNNWRKMHGLPMRRRAKREGSSHGKRQ